MKTAYVKHSLSPRPGAVRVIALSLALWTLAAPASATTVSGRADIDWSSLRFQFLQPGASYSLFSPDTFLYGNSQILGFSASSSDWVSSISAGAGTTDLDASLTADADTLSLSGKLNATPAFDSIYLNGERSGYLEISGSGMLVVSVAGTVSADVSDLDDHTYDAYALGSININLSSGALLSTGSLQAYAELFNFDLLSDFRSGVISAALNVHDGDFVRFNVFASTEISAGSFEAAPVPLPTSLPLFGAAWLALAALKRSRDERNAVSQQL